LKVGGLSFPASLTIQRATHTDHKHQKVAITVATRCAKRNVAEIAAKGQMTCVFLSKSQWIMGQKLGYYLAAFLLHHRA
jgi:hypothetical protein